MKRITTMTVTTTINREHIINSPIWTDWVISHPELTPIATDALDEIINWSLTVPSSLHNDYYYKPCTHLPCAYNDWDCDDAPDECPTWQEAESQMGTTRYKFSLSEYLVNKKSSFGEYNDESTLLILGHLFKTLGFFVFYAGYETWRKGYDYTLIEIDDTENENEKLQEHEHLCVTFKEDTLCIKYTS